MFSMGRKFINDNFLKCKELYEKKYSLLRGRVLDFFLKIKRNMKRNIFY